MDLKKGDIILYNETLTQLVLRVGNDEFGHKRYTFKILENNHKYDNYINCEKGQINIFYEHPPKMQKLNNYEYGNKKIMNILYG